VVRLASFLLGLLAVGFVSVLAQEGPPPVLILTGDAERGALIANQTCAACHGQNGNSVVPTFPRLSGQVQEFVAVQAWLFKEGIRPSPIMGPMAAQLSDQDIADVAAFFAGQSPAGQPWNGQDAAAAERGAVLFRQGNVEAGLIACAICHGRAGQGLPEQGIPRIAGQAPTYLGGILATFAQVPDFGEPFPNAMHIVASALSAEDTSAVIAFLASQPWGDQ
jgi:cytochrome c553